MTRIRNEKQLGLSANPGSLMVSSASNEATWLAPPAADRIAFYDLSTGSIGWLSLGAGLSFNGTTLETSAGAGFISAVQEEGLDIGAGVTTLNYIGSGFTAAKVGAVANVTLDADLNALADLTTIGLGIRTGAGTWTTRILAGTPGRVSVSNGDGIAGAPTINIDPNVAFKNASETITAAWTYSVLPQSSILPTIGDQFVNKTYVDGLLAGVRRASVVAATTGALTIIARTATTLTISPIGGIVIIDGETIPTGSRVLVKDSTTGSGGGAWDNGIYTTGAPSGGNVVLTRAADMDTAGEVDGTLVIIEDGTQAGQQWYTVSEVTTLGTDAINFTKIQVGVIDGSGATDRVAFWLDTDTLGSNADYRYSGGNLIVGTSGAGVAASRVTFRGSGTTSATFSLALQNSAGTNHFSFGDSGILDVGAITPLSITSLGLTRTGGITITPTGADLTLATGSQASTIIFGQANPWNHTSGDFAAIRSSSSFNPTSGSGNFNQIWLTPTINQTGGATGITSLINLNPTVTAGADVRLLNLTAPAGQHSFYSNSGKIRWNLGSDAPGDMYVRSATGELQRLPVGTNTQVLTGGTTPTWGPLPVVPTVEAFITGVTGLSIDLDANVGEVKDRDGNNIAFTAPTNLQKLFVYWNGVLIHPDGAGGTPDREYSVNTTTHVLTLSDAAVASDVFYLVKFA